MSLRLGAALAPFVALLLSLATTAAHANGRLPGATRLAIHPNDERQLLLGLTFGLGLSRDGGASWTWLCEQQIEGNGGVLDPSMVMTSDGSLVVLSLTNGGVLVSRDDGCTFERAMGPLSGQRGIDLTLDPSQPGRVLALLSTIVEVSDAGQPRYRNLVAHSLDHGRTWGLLAELPEDLSAETLEIAASDPNRIYVSGTASGAPLQGIVERSDDGGHRWKRTTVQLPRSSGSLFVSGIDPHDPNRVWFRVPGRGDIYGLLPARLWLSNDGATTFDQVADTQGGMLGFALSPDGNRIAFGGPLDGLYVAAADGSEPPSKVSDVRVSCLRWHSSGLYMCADEQEGTYGLGLGVDPAQGFVPVWHRSNACIGACGPTSHLAMTCRQPWETLAPLIGAEHESGSCDDSSSMRDAGGGSDAAGPELDGGTTVVDASPRISEPTNAPHARSERRGSCAVTLVHDVKTPWWLAAMLMLAFYRLSRHRSRVEARPAS
jgi:hypothetical protein